MTGAKCSFPCSVAQRRWQCALPVATQDLKLDLDGFVPRYFWDLAVDPAQAVDLGTVALIKGSSIAGWVEAADRRADLSAVTVSARPRQLAWRGDPGSAETLRFRDATAAVSRQGFFQVVGLEPAAYSLVVEAPGGLGARIDDVAVGSDEEQTLDDPLVLEPGRSLDLVLSPATDERGLPWTVVLMRYEPRTNYLTTLKRDLAGPDGTWGATDLTAIGYRIEVLDSRGSSWQAVDVDLGVATSPLLLELGKVRVVGRVVKGTEALPSEVVFGSLSGRPQVRIATDERGRFDGSLPRRGRWSVDVVLEEPEMFVRAPPVVVEPAPGKSFAEVEVSVPDTTIRGRVEDRDGRGVEAWVYVQRANGEERRLANAQSGEDGDFEIVGLPAGPFHIAARRGADVSPWQQRSLREGEAPPEVVLTLMAKTEITGRVLSAYGGVAGAAVVAVAASASAVLDWPAEATTGADGSFSLEVAGEPQVIDVAVVAAGLGLRLARITLSPERRFDIAVHPGTGTIVLRDPETFTSFVHHNGSAVSMLAVRDLFLRTGHLAAFVGGGLAFQGLAPGRWAFCPGRLAADPPCVEAMVAEGEVVILEPPADDHRAELDDGV